MEFRIFKSSDEARRHAEGRSAKLLPTAELNVESIDIPVTNGYYAGVLLSSSATGLGAMTFACITMAESGAWYHRSTLIEYGSGTTTVCFVAKE